MTDMIIIPLPVTMSRSWLPVFQVNAASSKGMRIGKGLEATVSTLFEVSLNRVPSLM